MKSFFAMETEEKRQQPPIYNPFDLYANNPASKESIILRTKKGDRSIEVEFPGTTSNMTDFTVPMSPSFTEEARGLASVPDQDTLLEEKYKDRNPSMTDREITHGLSKNAYTDDGKRKEVETELGLSPAEDQTPDRDRSYLAALDHIKQLYKRNRYEIALLELDEMIRLYPTDPKLYEMRGTLLDRTGNSELAIKSWSQALKLNANNIPLKRFIERKQAKRSLASP